MKILLINNFFTNFGGTEKSSFMQYKLLKSKGHEVYIFASNKSPYLIPDYEYARFFPNYKRFSDLSTKDKILNVYKSFYNSDAEIKLESYLKKIKPDLVHINNINYILTPSVINACYRNNIPVVMTLHDAGLMCPGITLMYKNSSLCRKELCIRGNSLHCTINKCFRNNTGQSVIASAEFLFRRMHKLYDKISFFVCPSMALIDLAIRSGIKKEKLGLVNNFIEDNLFKAAPSYTNEGYFLYIGRLDKEKGIHYLIEAMTRLPRDIKLHLAGTGYEETNLKEIVSRLNLTNIKFVGYKTGNELDKEYKNCIATILPCNWFEAFGLTIVESYIYGKPVIGSNVGAIPELIENGKTGILIEPESIDDLATAIKTLYYNNDLVRKMGKNGRNKAENSYTSQVYYTNLIKIYESLLYKGGE